MKFLSIYTPDPNTASTPPTPEHMAEMGKLVEESKKSGVLVSTGMLLPDPNGGTRVRRSGSEIEVSTKGGPLAEAAGRRAGFAVLEVKSREEAIEAARNFLKIAGDGECELCRLQVMEPDADCAQSQTSAGAAQTAAAPA
jgi:hypothetical protein